MATKILLRRDTAINWEDANPTLSNGEFGYVTDEGRAKIGNGVDDWDSLPYFTPALDDEFHDLEETEVNSDDDEIVIYDVEEGVYKKTTRRNFLKTDALNIVTTIAIAKAMTEAEENDLIYIPETETQYRYLTAGSAFTANDKNVLITGNAGNTRWIAVAGQYMVKNLNLATGTVLKIGEYQVVGGRQANISDVDITTVGTASGLYSTTEQTMINSLKADVVALKNKINALMEIIRTHGLMG